MSAYSVSYNFNPNDPMWILDNNSVKKATCLQVDIKVVPTTLVNFDNQITYIALLDCNAGTIVVDESNCYLTLEDAIAALQTAVQNQTC